MQDDAIIEGKTVKEGDLEVKFIKSGNYEQVQVLAGAIDNPDPRVGGSKIIFDSRLDRFSQPQSLTKEQARDVIRERQKELPPYTLQDKKDLLKKMLSKKNEPKKVVSEVDAAVIETEETK